MPVFQKYRRPCVALIVSLLFIGSAMQAIAKQTLFEAFKQIIVIDPGHGGQEFGARGPDGTLEKTVTLKLARLLADDLGREFKVVLTRTDDYLVDLVNRTSLANHLNADLFISIHTGASFAHSTAGIAIFFYQNFSKSDPGANQGPSSVDQKHNKPVLWENVQSRYLEKSQSLARAIDSRLKSINSNQSRIEGCPLVVLQGAAMPAILIEVGYLTNPVEEKKLRDDRYLIDLAEQIRRGIEDFFSQTKP